MEDSTDMSRMNWNLEDGWTPMVAQSLEYDADAIGAQNSLRYEIHWHNLFQSQRNQLPNESFDEFVVRQIKLDQHFGTFNNPKIGNISSTYTNTASAIACWAFSVTVLFRVFGFDAVDLTQLDRFSYPPIVLRCNIAMTTCASYFGVSGIEGISSELFSTIIQQAIVEADKTFNQITNNSSFSIVRNFTDTLLDREIAKHKDKLETQWLELLEYLRPLTWRRLPSDPIYRDGWFFKLDSL